MTKPNFQKDYTSFEGSYQVFLPFNLEFQVGKDDSVRLLRHCIGGMDITALEKTYQRIDRNLASPRQMLSIIVYARMNHIFSSRRIELACRRDINFMYLLEGKPVLDHTTIARFRSKHLAPCIKKLLLRWISCWKTPEPFPCRIFSSMEQKSNPLPTSISLFGKSLSRRIRPSLWKSCRISWTKPRKIFLFPSHMAKIFI